MKRKILWLLLILLCPLSRAYSSVTLFLEEPFGSFGYVNPTGHAAVYLSNVCADTPTHLRPCQPGEEGVVISRYHRVGGYDWVAIPLVPYLYAVDDVSEIPKSADAQEEAALRNAWRHKHLQQMIPDERDEKIPPGEWIQLIGSLYDRKIYAFEIQTSNSKDAALIEAYNHRANRKRFNLFFNNCADFSRAILDFYYPHSVRRSYTADLGMTTPKQLAKSLTKYVARHEELEMRVYALPQVPGSIPRSKQVDGVMEAMLRKKYLVPIACLHPYIAAGAALTYFTGGRFDPAKHATLLNEDNVVEVMWQNRPGEQTRPPSLTIRSASETSGVSNAAGFTTASWPTTSENSPPQPKIGLEVGQP
jgi:hypothetical protein